MDKNAIIRKDKNTIPKDLTLDLRYKTCFVDIISAANIQNWVKKIIGIINSGVIAKNLNKPGAWANPTAVKTFLNGTLVCLSGNNFTPMTKISIDHTNQVKIAVNPDIATAVLIMVFAATAPAIPSKIIIRPAKYIEASPKFLLSVYRDLSNLMDLKIIFRNSPNIYFFLFFCSLYETISGNNIKVIAMIMQIAIKKPFDILDLRGRS